MKINIYYIYYNMYMYFVFRVIELRYSTFNVANRYLQDLTFEIYGIRSMHHRNNSVSRDLISSRSHPPDDQLIGVRLFLRGVSSCPQKKWDGRWCPSGRWSEIKLSPRFYHALHSLSRRTERDISCDAPAPVICQVVSKISMRN